MKEKAARGACVIRQDYNPAGMAKKTQLSQGVRSAILGKGFVALHFTRPEPLGLLFLCANWSFGMWELMQQHNGPQRGHQEGIEVTRNDRDHPVYNLPKNVGVSKIPALIVCHYSMWKQGLRFSYHSFLSYWEQISIVGPSHLSTRENGQQSNSLLSKQSFLMEMVSLTMLGWL